MTFLRWMFHEIITPNILQRPKMDRIEQIECVVSSEYWSDFPNPNVKQKKYPKKIKFLQKIYFASERTLTKRKISYTLLYPRMNFD